MKFTCVECGRRRKEKHRCQFDWCDNCVQKERARSVREDRIAAGMFSRPPKFVIPPDQHKDFGY